MSNFQMLLAVPDLFLSGEPIPGKCGRRTR